MRRAQLLIRCLLTSLLGVGCFDDATLLGRQFSADAGVVAPSDAALLEQPTDRLSAPVPTDYITLGDAPSEGAHDLETSASETLEGGLATTSRRLLPTEPPDIYGGALSFSLRVDPERDNYITAKFWGGDTEADRDKGQLLLFVDGQQVGYRHKDTDIWPLDAAQDEPPLLGRFYYRTTLLPLSVTLGKQEVRLEIRSTGRVWEFGGDYAAYQRVLEQPSRAIYRVYSHVDPYFAPLEDEALGASPPDQRRATPGPEVLDAARTRTIDTLTRWLDQSPLGGVEIPLLARSYRVDWLWSEIDAYTREDVVDRVRREIDIQAQLFAAGSPQHQLDSDPDHYDWKGYGPVAEAIISLFDELEDSLAEPFDHDADAATPMLPRRDGWAPMLADSIEQRRHQRSDFTSHALFIDSNLYFANRALLLLGAESAMPETDALRYVEEAAGLRPFSGSDQTDGAAGEVHSGEYQLLTDKGLEREFGYVSVAAEDQRFLLKLWEVTGDLRFRDQLIKLVRGGAHFRYPSVDAAGNRVMRVEGVVANRQNTYPGDIVYGERLPFVSVAAAIGEIDAFSAGYAQQALADNQVFATLAAAPDDVLIDLVDDVETLMSLPASGELLPMSRTEEDFVWADEQNCVVALKHEDLGLFVNFQWFAYVGGVNRLAAVHAIHPEYHHLAIVRPEVEFTPSGEVFERPDWVDRTWEPGFSPPDEVHQAFAGEIQEYAEPPLGLDGPSARGLAEFYQLRYGPYFIALNHTKTKSFPLALPTGVAEAVNLSDDGAIVRADSTLSLTPETTIVLYLLE